MNKWRRNIYEQLYLPDTFFSTSKIETKKYPIKLCYLVHSHTPR